MAMLPQGMNLDAMEETERPTNDPLPAGEYLAHIVDSEIKKTKAETGHFLELKWAIDTPPYEKRFVWCRLNLDNPSPKAVEIAKGELKRIKNAIGIVGDPQDSAQLHGVPVTIKLKVVAATAQYLASNSITEYKKVGAEVATQTTVNEAAPTNEATPWG